MFVFLTISCRLTLKGKQNCVIIGIVQDEVSMKDVPCENMNANLICQRKIDSFGYEDSVERTYTKYFKIQKPFIPKKHVLILKYN